MMSICIRIFFMSELEIDKLVIVEYTEKQDCYDFYGQCEFPTPAVNEFGQRQLVFWEPLFLNVYINEGNEADGSIDHR